MLPAPRSTGRAYRPRGRAVATPAPAGPPGAGARRHSPIPFAAGGRCGPSRSARAPAPGHPIHTPARCLARVRRRAGCPASRPRARARRRRGPTAVAGRVAGTEARSSHHPFRRVPMRRLANNRRLLLLVSLLTPATPAAAQAPRVILLGTGTPNADPARSGPATAVLVGNRAFIIDAGPGVVRRAAAAAQQWSEPGLTPPNLTMVLLTHLHSDHTLGLPDLLLTPWTLERTAPLTVIGPPGTRWLAGKLAEAFQADVRNRLGGREPANRTGVRVQARGTEGGAVRAAR